MYAGLLEDGKGIMGDDIKMMGDNLAYSHKCLFLSCFKTFQFYQSSGRMLTPPLAGDGGDSIHELVNQHQYGIGEWVGVILSRVRV